MAAVPSAPPAAPAAANPYFPPTNGSATPATDSTETTDPTATATATGTASEFETEDTRTNETHVPNGHDATDDDLRPKLPPRPSSIDAREGLMPTDQSVQPLNIAATTTRTRSTTQQTGHDARDTTIEIDDTKPADFDGEIQTNNDLPTPQILKKIEKYVVLDRHGKSHTFKSLYSGRNAARRVLIIFIRHFFCGNCQEFLRSLSESVTPDALLGLPMSTFIAVVGCGNPGLIDMYLQETGCPFPVYTDPTRRLFAKLGMTRTLALGTRPAYMRKSMIKSAAESVFQGLKQVKAGLATKSGDHRQVGGEFLFEPVELVTEVSTPYAERQIEEAMTSNKNSIDSQEGIDGEGDDDFEPEEKRVTWCHRMRSTRDHAEIPELMEVLGLTGSGKPPAHENKRWSKALEMRKGTGLSMASQMSKLNEQQERA
ncbi:Putative peroxiredoxin-like 2A/B/C, Thioredoxin-like superfamily [Colletotrichum destructivum]|uniref:Peroxiredoxin-like 2A/B/C, Thioredoxin-like superfamily n=1 Tax=Colletotrichum destructivum TaxID=34406 RepID=A0AAX4J0D2_9PEZI|nr:Putative peroxiredoxin-like 2A/B/C, Thioredoxin-like superfamily [Colletotrichum destructivum]